jgi:hypothetical protein
MIGWRVYARFRRAVGRHRLSKVRPWITLAIFSLLVVFLAYAARTHVDRLEWLAGGLASGTLLALYGLRLTQFEPAAEDLFYTPNAYLGIAMSLLFLGRILFRLVEVFAIKPGAFHGPQDFARSPFTLAVFGLIAGYYMSYSIGLVLWRSRVLQAQRTLEGP